MPDFADSWQLPSNRYYTDPCESAYQINGKNWFEITDSTMNQFQAENLCRSKGGSLAYPTTKEEFECYRKLKRSWNYVEAWIGVTRKDGSPDYVQTTGTVPPYVEDWLKDPKVTNIPVEKGLFVKLRGPNLPEMRSTDRTALVRAVICKRAN